jgi:hypothetical protein
MLEGFVGKGIVDTKKLNLMDKIIRQSEEDQFRVLNDASLSLDEQMSVFGAIRNVNMAIRSMKERLESAAEKHENPTTAELALELMPSFFNLAPDIDEVLHENRVVDLNYISKFSRILYKKTRSLGFSRDVASQLDEANISGTQIRAFLESLKKNVALELDIEEEASSSDESSNRNVSTS